MITQSPVQLIHEHILCFCMLNAEPNHGASTSIYYTKKLLKWGTKQKDYFKQNSAVVELFDKRKNINEPLWTQKYISFREHIDQWIYMHVILVETHFWTLVHVFNGRMIALSAYRKATWSFMPQRLSYRESSPSMTSTSWKSSQWFRRWAQRRFSIKCASFKYYNQKKT